MLSICAIFKNEYPFILEWISYHRCLGIYNYHIADNISSDGSTELLKSLEKIGIINLYEYQSEDGTPPQLEAYNTLLSSSDNEWLAFIDADEFITPNNFEDGLSELMGLLDDEKISAVALNWAVYGSSCSIIPENALVIERFNKRAHQEHPVNLHYKSIVRKNHTLSSGSNPHEFTLTANKEYIKTTGDVESKNNGLSAKVDWSKARVNHYVIKSKAEFITKKTTRGRATTLESKLNRTLNFFRGHDLNQVEENIPRWFINRVKLEKHYLINKLKSINYQYSDLTYSSPLYRTAFGMGKGHIDNLNVLGSNIQINGWAIDRNNAPVRGIIAVLDSVKIIYCLDLSFRNRMDLANAGLGDGISSGFNATFKLPSEKISAIEFYGVDTNGLAIVELKSNIDIVEAIN